MSTNRFDEADVKRRARGQWARIVSSLGNIEEACLDGKHHACPKCGGKDRFRFTDMNGDGSVICNQCARDIGDGFGTLMWLNEEDFPTALGSVAVYLGVPPSFTKGYRKNNGHTDTSQPVVKSPATPSDFEKQFHRWTDTHFDKAFAEFAVAKPPITVDAIRQSGAIVCRWPKSRNHGLSCIAWPTYNAPGELTGYLLRRVDGRLFPAFGDLPERKTHNLNGSHDGWVLCGGFQRVERATTVWRVEGIPDALAMFPHLPSDQAVITNICGARSVKDLNIEILRGKTVYSVGDADEPGQEGAAQFATAVVGIANEIRIVKLPYEIDPSHGRDVRDFFDDGNTIDALQAIANAAKPFAPSVKERSGTRAETSPKSFTIRSAGELIRDFPELREPIIEGLIRRGEMMNIIAPPKTGKSWLVMGLALSIASGRKWLGRFLTKPGKVLIVDNELHPEITAHRLPKIAEAMGIHPDEYADRLFVINLRGELIDLKTLAIQLVALPKGEYSLIILDAWYRFQPEGSDENSNADVSALYNLLDSVAAKIGSAFVSVHHTSKGSQAGKGVTDVGSGAGAQSRAADAHLVMRQHEVDGAVVVDAAVRSFPRVDSFCLRLNFPIWEPADDLDPKTLRSEKPRIKTVTAKASGPSKEERQKKRDADNLEKILTAYRTFPDGETVSVLSESAGVNSKYFRPIQAQLIRDGKVVAVDVQKSHKKPFPGFKLVGLESTPTLRHSDKNDNSSDLSDHESTRTPTTAPPLGGSVCRSAVSCSLASDEEKCGLFA